MPDLITVILAGTLRPSPLHEALGAPALALPIAPGTTLLEAWRSALDDAGAGDDVRIVVNNSEEIDGMSDAARQQVRALVEPAAWRGTAGVLRDVTSDLSDDGRVLVVEATCLPPSSLAPVLETLAGDVAGVIGVGGDDEPAGVYVLRRRALETAPGVGYHDLKEQLLPTLHENGAVVVTAALDDAIVRVRDRRSYLEAVRHRLARGGDERRRHLAATQTAVSGSALVEGFALIESGAVVEDGAVVHESIILAGATVGGGAVVSRSVIGPMVRLAPRSRTVRQIIVASPDGAPVDTPDTLAGGRR